MQYSQTDLSFPFSPFHWCSFLSALSSISPLWSRSLIPYLHFLAHFSLSFLPHFLCVQKRVCLDLHPFSPAFSLSLSPPVAPFSSSPTHFFTFPLTITHPNSPTFPLFPSTPIPLIFFSPSLFAELIWTFSWSIQRDPDQNRPRGQWQNLVTQTAFLGTITAALLVLSRRQHLIKQTFLSRTSSTPPITRQQSLVHSCTFNFCVSFCLPVNPWHFQAARSRMFPQALFCFSFRRLRPFFFFLWNHSPVLAAAQEK